MKTKWATCTEYADGTGRLYYECVCPQPDDDGNLDKLYNLCYFPSEKRLWFWDKIMSDSVTIRMTANSWEDAEKVKSLLTRMKSHWMEKHLKDE